MNKYLFLIFITSLASDIINAQSPDITFGSGPNDEEKIKINRIIKESIYNYNFNRNAVKDSTLTNTFYYDTAGFPKEEILAKVKNYDESLTKYSNSYSGEGKLLKQVVNMINLDMITIYEYEYDKKGNEVNKYEYNADTTRLTIYQKTYNEKNQVLQLQTKINNDNIYVSRKYYYDRDDKLIKTEAFDKVGELIYTYIYEYDKPENKKIVYLENTEGKKIEGEYFYNNDNLCIKVKSTAKIPSFISNGGNSEYNKSSQLIENIYYPDKMLFETNIYLDGKKVQMTRHYYLKEKE